MLFLNDKIFFLKPKAIKNKSNTKRIYLLFISIDLLLRYNTLGIEFKILIALFVWLSNSIFILKLLLLIFEIISELFFFKDDKDSFISSI